MRLAGDQGLVLQIGLGEAQGVGLVGLVLGVHDAAQPPREIRLPLQDRVRDLAARRPSAVRAAAKPALAKPAIHPGALAIGRARSQIKAT